MCYSTLAPKIDIVKSGFDAGIRRGGLVAKDMIAVQIGKPNVMVTVATPDYFAHYGKPKQPNDIIHHRCIAL